MHCMGKPRGLRPHLSHLSSSFGISWHLLLFLSRKYPYAQFRHSPSEPQISQAASMPPDLSLQHFRLHFLESHCPSLEQNSEALDTQAPRTSS